VANLFDLIPPASTPVLDSWQPPEPPSLADVREIELDCETTGLRWWAGDLPIGIAVRLPDGKSYYLPWGHASGNLDEAAVKRWCLRELRGKRITNLNTRFDVHMLRAWGVDLAELGCTVSDVGHYAALLDDHRKSFSLENISHDYLKSGKFTEVNGQRIDATRMASYPAAVVAPYAERDVWLVGELKRVMWPLLEGEDLQQMRQLEDDLIFPVVEMECNGAPLDVEKLAQWTRQSEKDYTEALFSIYRQTGLRVNPDSSDDLQKLFHHLGLEITAFTEKGRPSFTDAVLKNIAHPVIQLVRRAGKLADLRSKYLCKYSNSVGPDGILRYALHQLRADEGGTVSGRFSSSGLVNGVGANIQQVMAVEKQVDSYGEDYIVRELFVPRAGLFLSSDAAQIEYRLFAHHAASPTVLKAYEDDPRVSFHKTVWNLVLPYKPDLKYKPLKNLNFAKLYGAGPRKLALMLGMTEGEARSVLRVYAQLFPEVDALLARASRLAEERGYVRTFIGRRMRFPDKQRIHKALNGIIQGTAADVMKLKLIELYRTRRETGLTLRLTVHDEVCGDVPDAEAAQRVDEILNQQTGFLQELRVPILWETNVGKNWKECKS
jgi:DNA polymerase-1